MKFLFYMIIFRKCIIYIYIYKREEGDPSSLSFTISLSLSLSSFLSSGFLFLSLSSFFLFLFSLLSSLFLPFFLLPLFLHFSFPLSRSLSLSLSLSRREFRREPLSFLLSSFSIQRTPPSLATEIISVARGVSSPSSSLSLKISLLFSLVRRKLLSFLPPYSFSLPLSSYFLSLLPSRDGNYFRREEFSRLSSSSLSLLRSFSPYENFLLFLFFLLLSSSLPRSLLLSSSLPRSLLLSPSLLIFPLSLAVSLSSPRSLSRRKFRREERQEEKPLSRDFRLSSPFLYLYLSLSLSLASETNSVAEKSEERPSLPSISLLASPRDGNGFRREARLSSHTHILSLSLSLSLSPLSLSSLSLLSSPLSSRLSPLLPFLSLCRFAGFTRAFDRTDFDGSGLTGILKERGHQINGQKCSRLKSRYLTILMELRAEISWA